MTLNVEKIYICHYKKLTDRKQHIIQQLERFGLTNYYFVEEQFDKDTWNMQEILKQYPNINDTDMLDSLKSLSLKHAWIVEDMYKNGYSSVLVLEDDAVLCDDFVNKYNMYVQQMPSDWDIGWVGSCFHLKEPYKHGINVYKTKRGSRCTHAFCLSKKFAYKMVDEMKRISGPPDFYYNRIVEKFDLNNYWFQPPLALQSIDFPSSCNKNPNHKWNPQEMG